MTLTLQKKNEILQIPPEDISPSPHQPRRHFAAQDMQALSQSIQLYGILQPLVVKPSAYGYYLVAGERRLRAAKMAGCKTVPCILYDRGADDCALATMVENLQRKNLSYWEEAYGYKALLTQFEFTQQQLAEKVGKSQSAVANKLRLLKLPMRVQAKLAQANLSERHARTLLSLTDEEQMEQVVDTMISKGFTVTQSERYVARLLQHKEPPPKPTALVRDRRICRNTLDKAVELIRQAGIKAQSHSSETDDFIEYIIRIPKQ